MFGLISDFSFFARVKIPNIFSCWVQISSELLLSPGVYCIFRYIHSGLHSKFWYFLFYFQFCLILDCSSDGYTGCGRINSPFMENNKNKTSWDITKYVFTCLFTWFWSFLLCAHWQYCPLLARESFIHPTITPTVNSYCHTVFLKKVGTQNTEVKNRTPSCYFWAFGHW